jgi:serine/threonine-protein kinase
MDEALAEIARAQELDPLSNPLKANRALLLYFQGKYDDALRELAEISRADPKLPLVHWGIGLCQEQRGDGAAALAALTHAASLSGGLNIKASLGHAYGAFGKAAEARKVLAALRERARANYVPSYHFALVHAGLGEDELALEWLERAYQERSTVLAYVRLDPRLARLRALPRFVKLLERLGLPEPGARMGGAS